MWSKYGILAKNVKSKGSHMYFQPSLKLYYLLVAIILHLRAPIASSNPMDLNIFTQQSQHLVEEP